MSEHSTIWLERGCADPLFYEVLRVRSAAYIHAEKVRADASWSELQDELDDTAQIALLILDEHAVGTIRLDLSPRPDHPYYLRQRGHRLAFPDLSESIAASKMAVVPSMKGTGLFRCLHDLMPRGALACGRRYVTGSSSGWLREVYRRYGWDFTGITYASPDYLEIPHEFMRLDVGMWSRLHDRSAEAVGK